MTIDMGCREDELIFHPFPFLNQFEIKNSTLDFLALMRICGKILGHIAVVTGPSGFVLKLKNLKLHYHTRKVAASV